MTRHLTILLCGLLTLAGCEKESPPRSVTEFAENPMLLEAAIVRCSQDRSKTRYDAECVNARLAVARVQAREEAARKSALEESSEKKRDALRRRQEAVAEARRRAAEAERLRKEAEYLAQFGVEPPGNNNESTAIPGDAASQEGAAAPLNNEPGVENAAPPDTEADGSPPVSDLESVREELRRRSQESGN